MTKYKKASSYKQMAFETAVRNPERYKGILTTIEPFIHQILDDTTLLKIISSLYLNGIVSSKHLIITEDSTIESIQEAVVNVNNTRKADGGFPAGYQSRFWTYMRTLSEMGFVYAQYNRPLRFSQIAFMLIKNELDEQEAFSIQAMKYNRKSPYRNVSNDFNFFRFILEVLKVKERITYEQFIISTFSRDGDVGVYLKITEENTFADQNNVFPFIKQYYNTNLKAQTILRDYPDVVLRLLIITGFVSVQYKGHVFIYRNIANDNYINELLSIAIEVTDHEKASPLLYFEKLETFNKPLLDVIYKYREVLPDTVGFEYTQKVSEIIKTYELSEAIIVEGIKNIGLPHNPIPAFKYIAEPLKLEFYLSLMLAMKYGNEYAIKPNYKADYIGLPISHAPGNKGDIEVFSETLYWLIEVTLIRNKTQQLNNETTSVIRHFKEDNRINQYTTKYLSFVAPYIHEDTSKFYDFCIVMDKIKDQSLHLKPYSIGDFVSVTLANKNFSDMEEYTNKVLDTFRNNML